MKNAAPTYIIVLLLILLAASVAGGAYFYQKANGDQQELASNDLEETIASVGRLMVLPEGEEPTLATVSDPEKLKGQPFFANAQKGDKVLIYAIAGKAILYNPTLDKIVEIAPINAKDIGTQAGTPLQTNE